MSFKIAGGREKRASKWAAAMAPSLMRRPGKRDASRLPQGAGEAACVVDIEDVGAKVQAGLLSMLRRDEVLLAAHAPHAARCLSSC